MRSLFILMTLAATLFGTPAQAQDYPSKTITVTLVLAAGTGLDVVARTWGEQLALGLGRPVVFDNRPGANGIVAANAVNKISPQSIVDVAAGHVQLAFAEAGASRAFIRDQRLRALAVSSLTRFNSLPDVPTLAEATGRRELEAVSWHALAAPAATPRAILNRLHSEMTRILNLPEVSKVISSLDLIPVTPASIESQQQYIAAEARKWGDLVRKLGLAGSQ